MWEQLLELLETPGPMQIAVIGDFMLDAYLYGDAERVSPEAPVPVLRVIRETFALGGAGSVAADIAALGDRPICFGVLGDDAAANSIREQLRAVGADASGLIVESARPTTRKTRLVGLAQHRHRQQMMRIDAEQTDPISEAVARRLVDNLAKIIANCRAICLQDYAKGVVTPQLAQAVNALAKKSGV